MKKQQPGQDLWTPRRLSDFLGVSLSSVYAWANDGRVPALFLSMGSRKKVIRFRPEEIEEWLNRKSNRSLQISP